MRIALIADTFPPFINSGAVQLRDLSIEFVRQGHDLTVVLPSCNQLSPWHIESLNGMQILHLKTPKIKGTGYIRRTISELIMPFAMLYQLKKTKLADEQWDGVVWYSPSIFHGPLVKQLKKSSGCKGYLIIRDIFPEWALDLGLMGRGLPYFFFSAVAHYQYSLADVIGVQSAGNLIYFKKWIKSPYKKIEVLNNWLDKPVGNRCSIRISQTILKGKKIFLYAGNMGIAQSVHVFIDLAEKFLNREDVGFLFVGRGVSLEMLKSQVNAKKISNILFFDEISPDEMNDLCSQCVAGIVALNPNHKSHNIPGKFLMYMQNGLPVLANLNTGNDLVRIIKSEKVGRVCENNNLEELFELAESLLLEVATDADITFRCISLFEREYSAYKAVQQIVSAFRK
jgi:glycosyltransferase involved in cell wall biosynthesis